MPQTIEHLQILQYLNVRETIVVLTKMDLIPPEQAGAVCKNVYEELKETMAANAPIFAVSTLTGQNLDALREGIHETLARLPQCNPSAPAYLPIDRVFALPGHGTIVTGTLMQGRIAIGDTLALQPSGKRVRVRSLQSFGEKRDFVEGGARAAVNIPSVAVHDIARGEMLVAPQFEASDSFLVEFTPLEAALAILRRRNAVRAYIGSAEILGTLVFEEIPRDLQTVRAELFLRKATVAYPGTAYVLRRLSPKDLLGGGTIARSAGIVESVQDAPTAPESSVLAALAQAGLAAPTAGEIARSTNLREDGVEEALEALVQRGEVLRIAKPTAYVHESAAARVFFED